jgi:hypothetical protein
MLLIALLLVGVGVGCAQDNETTMSTRLPLTIDGQTHNINVIMLVDLNEPIFDVIFKYIEWTVHSQKLLPENYHLKLVLNIIFMHNLCVFLILLGSVVQRRRWILVFEGHDRFALCHTAEK